MTHAARELAGRMQRILIDLAELDKTAPHDVDFIVGAMIAHLRSWRPVSVAPLGTLPDPEEEPVDPRTVTKPLRGTGGPERK